MVGVAVVTLFTVFAASVKASIDESVSKQFGGDLVIATQNFSAAGLSPQMAADIQELPEVDIATGLGIGTLTIDGDDEDITNGDPAKIAELIDADVTVGLARRLVGQPDRGVAEGGRRPELEARSDRLRPCSRSTTPPKNFEIGAIYDSPELPGTTSIPKARGTHTMRSPSTSSR